MKKFPLLSILAMGSVLLLQIDISSQSLTTRAHDPGVRGGDPGAGGPIPGLTPQQLEYFDAGKLEFEEAEAVDEGIGPRMNLDSCQGCHLHPSVGGSSPAINPQIAFAGKDGGTDLPPSFLSLDGPVREARFVKNRDGTADRGA